MRYPVLSAVLAVQLVAACAGLVLMTRSSPRSVKGDIVVLTIGGRESYVNISGHTMQEAETPPEALTSESRVDIDGDSLRVVLHYKDTERRGLDACVAEYRSVTYACAPGGGYFGKRSKRGFIVTIPGDLGLSAEKIAELRRQDIPSQWGDIGWLIIGAAFSLTIATTIAMIAWKMSKGNNWKKVVVSASAGILLFITLNLIYILFLLVWGYVD